MDDLVVPAPAPGSHDHLLDAVRRRIDQTVLHSLEPMVPPALRRGPFADVVAYDDLGSVVDYQSAYHPAPAQADVWRNVEAAYRQVEQQRDYQAPADNWAEAQLRRFTYKPGFRLSCRPAFGTREYFIAVRMWVPDTYVPARMTEVGGSFLVPSFLIDHNDEDGFARWLLEQLVEMERHEAREWFRRDGQIFDNPHAPRARS